MEIYLTKNFLKWANRSGLTLDLIIEATVEMESGLVDVDLGSHLFKKRIARPGQGKRAGFRSIVVCNKGRYFYVHGFAKSTRDNVRPDELLALRALANQLISMSRLELKTSEFAGKLISVEHNDQRH